jgi:hypothetical protein
VTRHRTPHETRILPKGVGGLIKIGIGILGPGKEKELTPASLKTRRRKDDWK